MAAEAAVKGRQAQGRGPRDDKVEKVEALQKQFQEVSTLVLFNYRGLSVAQMTDLRRRTREAGVDLAVVKNTLLHRAVEGTSYEVVRGHLEGPVSIATTTGDPTGPAKILKTFMKDVSGGELRGGVLDGKFLSPPEVEALADLPSREVLLSRLLGALQAPVAGLPRLLNGVAAKLLYALQAIAKQKE